jgi:hypothetical protein
MSGIDIHVYERNGIVIDPAPPRTYGSVKVSYNGLLAKSGAAELYVHTGFGEKWNDIHDYQMSKTANGFEAKISVHSADTLNIAFKDCANNWDNNSGRNYSFDIEH